MKEKLLPRYMFFTKGVGFHKNKLQSFELALRDAGVEICNLVSVSSIMPPECKIITKPEGLEMILPGQITFVVMSKAQTDEPGRRIAAAIGLAQPKDKKQYGYISEHHSFGQNTKEAGDFAEDLAATMLGSTLGIEVDPDAAWDERKQVYKISAKQQFVSRSISKMATGQKNGWTTVVALAVMLLND